MLLEAHVDGGQIAADVCDAIDGERTRERIAPAPFAKPVEASLRRVMERVALEVGVIPGLELRERARALEVTEPRLVSPDADAEVAFTCRHLNDCVRLRVVVGLTATDVITDVALEAHGVRSPGCARTRGPRLIRPAARRCHPSEGEQHPAQRSNESHGSSPSGQGSVPNVRAGSL